jgi:maltokinase
MLQAFAANAAEGWAMAMTSVRDLFADTATPPTDAGADFAAEARRLGGAVAAVHADLARELGTDVVDARSLSDGMTAHLESALAVVPELAPRADRLRAAFAAVAAVPGGVPVQRVHGDLHLGQALRTPATWLLIDFEGEPAGVHRGVRGGSRVRPHRSAADRVRAGEGRLRDGVRDPQPARLGRHPAARGAAAGGPGGRR